MEPLKEGNIGMNAFINFNGNCREAMAFYAKVFKQDAPEIMIFADAPPMEGWEMNEADKEKVMYADLNIKGSTIMFSDVPSGMPFIQGSSIQLSIGDTDKAEIERLYEALKEGGKVMMPLQETFFSPCYAYLVDQFGIPWHLSYDDGKNK